MHIGDYIRMFLAALFVVAMKATQNVNRGLIKYVIEHCYAVF